MRDNTLRWEPALIQVAAYYNAAAEWKAKDRRIPQNPLTLIKAIGDSDEPDVLTGEFWD